MHKRQPADLLWGLPVIRAARGMTQAALARATRLDQSYISRLERGVRPTEGIHTIGRIANALGVSKAILTADAITVMKSGKVRKG